MPAWVLPAGFGIVALVAVGIVWWSYRATRRLGGAEKEKEIYRAQTRRAKAAARILASPLPLGRVLRKRLRQLAEANRSER